MHPLTKCIEELHGLQVRLHLFKGESVATVDGICRGIEDGWVVLAPSSEGERTDVPLKHVGAVTQLAARLEE